MMVVTYAPISCALSDDSSGVKVQVLQREVAFDIVREVFVFLSTENKWEIRFISLGHGCFGTLVCTPAHIWTFAKDATSRWRYLLRPLRGLLWPVPGVRGVAGSPGVCGVHGVWGPIAPESPNLSKLFTWYFGQFIFAKRLLMEKLAYRFRHLWQWSLLQWILAGHNTWVDRV